jgi:nitrile hydratase accessory protein
MSAIDRSVSGMGGPAAPPRRNGELVFEAPWQGRAFGIGVALCQGGLYAWEAFQGRLIATVAETDASGEPALYYEQWMAALETLLVEKGVLSRAEIEARTVEFRSGAREA